MTKSYNRMLNDEKGDPVGLSLTRTAAYWRNTYVGRAFRIHDEVSHNRDGLVGVCVDVLTKVTNKATKECRLVGLRLRDESGEVHDVMRTPDDVWCGTNKIAYHEMDASHAVPI